MIEIIYKLIDLIMQFINSIYNFKIDFANGSVVSLGTIVVAFIFFVLLIYLLLRSIGIGKDDD